MEQSFKKAGQSKEAKSNRKKKTPVDSNNENVLRPDKNPLGPENSKMLEGMSPLWREFYVRIGEKLRR